MTEVELTEAMISAVMAKADARVCIGSDRCFAFPDRLQDARQSCTPKGRCKVGWVVSRGGRESWDVWLEVATGLVKLIAQANARANDVSLAAMVVSAGERGTRSACEGDANSDKSRATPDPPSLACSRADVRTGETSRPP
jgi:hypothetical protein